MQKNNFNSKNYIKLIDFEHPYINVVVIRGDKRFNITCKSGESILEALIQQDIYFSAYCGGRGSCGKCKVKLIEGFLEITRQDRDRITEKELDEGYRLSCHSYPKSDCTILLDTGDESDFDIIVDSLTTNSQVASLDESYGIAVDIGTTTIVFCLVGLQSKNIIKTYASINKQGAYGADVISRMQASKDGKGLLLQNMIRKDLLEGFVEVINLADVNKYSVKQVTIAGNTTMGHIFMGYSCETLGSYPYTPVNIGRIEMCFKDAFETDFLDAMVILIPGISTFVGADIVAGLTSCKFDQMDLPCLFIDLGTNGEIALGNKNNILVSSTAAGPAFEGGNISCGIGSVAGAICSVTIEEDGPLYQTINDKPPEGICGTGVIEIVSELLRTGLVDETGLMDEAYFEDGYEIANKEILDKDKAKETYNKIVVTQRDIREILLAKAAVRAGLETLINQYGVTYNDIQTVFLAGGFGYNINIQKAIHIGLLPEELSGKIKVIGNSSLAGAILELTEKDTCERMNKIIDISKEINLSGDRVFNELYVEHMFF